MRTPHELRSWDVVLFSPAGSALSNTLSVGGFDVRRQFRKADHKVSAEGGSYFAVSGGASRVASRGAERAGLSDPEIEAAKKNFESDHASGRVRNISDKHYRDVRSRPLLMLHVLGLSTKEREPPSKGAEPIVDVAATAAWGISFPWNEAGGESPPEDVEYVVNTRWWQENYGDDIKEYQEEEEGANSVG
jgi:hypothetical protein